MNVIEYCAEEVERQGHDILILDGIERVGFMLDAWSHALLFHDKRPSIMDAIILGRKIEPQKNPDIRTCYVRGGDE